MDHTKLLTISEAATRLSVSANTLRAWADAGHVAHVRTPTGHRRFDPAALDAFAASLRVPARGNAPRLREDRSRAAIRQARGIPSANGGGDVDEETNRRRGDAG